MALTQITFNDKVENSGATDDGKVLAVNMNEIKSVTNALITDYEANSFTDYYDGLNSNGRTPFVTLDANTIFRNSRYGLSSSSANIPVATGGYINTMVNSGGDFGTQVWTANFSTFPMYIRSALSSTVWGNWRAIAEADDLVQATNSTLGTSAGSNITTETNSTCLGNNAQVTASAQVQLGNSSTTTYAYGPVQDRSDLRDKADIQDVHLGLDFINALTPRSYKFDYREDYREHTTEMQEIVIGQDEDGNDITEEQEVMIPDTRSLGELEHDGTHKRSRLHCGLVAQEVKQVMDDLGVDFAGYQDHSLAGGQDVLSIGYGELISPMIKAIQELKQEIEMLKQR